MSVKTRMDRYWNHDTTVGRRILKEIGWSAFMDMKPGELDAVLHSHRLTGSMRRFSRKYRRLNNRGHLASVVRRECDRQIEALENNV